MIQTSMDRVTSIDIVLANGLGVFGQDTQGQGSSVNGIGNGLVQTQQQPDRRRNSLATGIRQGKMKGCALTRIARRNGIQIGFREYIQDFFEGTKGTGIMQRLYNVVNMDPKKARKQNSLGSESNHRIETTTCNTDADKQQVHPITTVRTFFSRGTYQHTNFIGIRGGSRGTEQKKTSGEADFSPTAKCKVLRCRRSVVVLDSGKLSVKA